MQAPGPRTPSAEDFSFLADHLPEAAWIADPTGWIYWYNNRWYSYTGTTPEEMRGWGWQAVHDPKKLPLVLEEWQRSIDTGLPFEMVFPLRGADGVFRPFLTRVRPKRDGAGRITHWFGSNTEVTEQENQRRLLTTLNETAKAVSAELNLETLVQHVTDAGVELTGAQFGAFFYNVVREDGEAYTLYTISGVPRDRFSRFPMPRNTKVFEPTFRGAGPVRSDNIQCDPRFGQNAPYHGMPAGHLPVCSYLAVPVISRSGEVLGGLFFGHAKEAVFTREHEQLLTGIAARAAIGIDNARLYNSAQRELAERKHAEEQRQLLVQELNHRVKNLFAIIGGMIATTSKSGSDIKEFANSLKDRVMALGRAHELIYGAPNQVVHPKLDFTDVLKAILAPHANSGNLTMQGPRVSAAPKMVTGLALVFHELATNAVKYGALSKPEGNVDVCWRMEQDELLVEWKEAGGPSIISQPERNGFGTKLIQLTARGTFGGRLSFDWRPHGLLG